MTNATRTLKTSAAPPNNAAANGRDPRKPTSHSAMIRPRSCSGARSCTTVLSPVIAQPKPSPATAKPARARAVTVPMASSPHPATSSQSPIAETRAAASHPPIEASATMPTAAPMPNAADSAPTRWAPPPRSLAMDGVSVIEGSEANPTVVTASSASSRGRSRQTYASAARTR
nr:hypothetical protein CPGR_05316 [Mycolicibacterium fortuitum subsp. fortuitum DSM 46621 = ATCC 6841 = JCM 6387]